ncbi:MAG: alpha/beta hydrolase [Archaeoglobus sp.]|nr:alpha/beta hydrolase [Archaeoglobus sp.]
MSAAVMELKKVRLNFYKSEDTPIVYIHGSGGTGKVWAHQLSAIGGYAIDLPGHGGSADDESISTVEDYARHVVEFIKEEVGQAYVAGHSLGGAIAQTVYLMAEDVVRGLILVGTGARLRVLPELLDGLINDFENTAKKLVEMLFSRNFKDEGVKRKTLEEILECGSEVTYRDFNACDKFDLLSEYKEGRISVGVPVLCIVGKDDIMTPPKYSAFFEKTIGARVVEIEDAGHMVMLEKPEEVNKAILEFLEI